MTYQHVPRHSSARVQISILRRLMAQDNTCWVGVVARRQYLRPFFPTTTKRDAWRMHYYYSNVWDSIYWNFTYVKSVKGTNFTAKGHTWRWHGGTKNLSKLHTLTALAQHKTQGKRKADRWKIDCGRRRGEYKTLLRCPCFSQNP
jgi:hypothetical protein